MLANIENEVLRKTHRRVRCWVEIPGYRGLYASTEGEIWSDKKGGTKIQSIKRKVRNGYPTVYLYQNGRDRPTPVHRLVALAFHGQPPSDRHTVDHINRNRLDNRADNLRWATPIEQAVNRDDFWPIPRRLEVLRTHLRLLKASPGYADELTPELHRALEHATEALG